MSRHKRTRKLRREGLKDERRVLSSEELEKGVCPDCGGVLVPFERDYEVEAITDEQVELLDEAQIQEELLAKAEGRKPVKIEPVWF